MTTNTRDVHVWQFPNEAPNRLFVAKVDYDAQSTLREAAEREVIRLSAELAESKNVQSLGDVFKRIAELQARADEHVESLKALGAERDALRKALEKFAKLSRSFWRHECDGPTWEWHLVQAEKYLAGATPQPEASLVIYGSQTRECSGCGTVSWEGKKAPPHAPDCPLFGGASQTNEGLTKL